MTEEKRLEIKYSLENLNDILTNFDNISDRELLKIIIKELFKIKIKLIEL